MKKTRLKRIGKRAKREAPALKAFREEVLIRCYYGTTNGVDKYRCERCSQCFNRSWFDAHHRKPQSRGGEHARENSAGLCRWCHGKIHDHQVADWKDWLK